MGKPNPESHFQLFHDSGSISILEILPRYCTFSFFQTLSWLFIYLLIYLVPLKYLCPFFPPQIFQNSTQIARSSLNTILLLKLCSFSALHPKCPSKTSMKVFIQVHSEMHYLVLALNRGAPYFPKCELPNSDSQNLHQSFHSAQYRADAQ